MKIHCAIKSCHTHHPRRTAVLDTWFRPLQNLDVDVYFVVGNPRIDIPDTLSCAVSDSFQDIAPKVLSACLYALDENADLLFLADDDTYVAADRLVAAAPKHHDYVGFMRTWGLDYNKGIPYAQGSGQWLSARAMEFVALAGEAVMRPGIIDDGALGQALDGKVAFVHDRRYWPGPGAIAPAALNNIISTHKVAPDTMRLMDKAYKAGL